MEEQTTISAKDKLFKIDTILDEYEKSVGLPACKSPGTEDELNKYFLMNRKEIESLTPEDCSEISVRLMQFGFYLQRLCNREKSRIIWVKQKLIEYIAKQLNSYDKFTKYDIKVALIIKEDNYAYDLQQILTYAEQRFTRLELLSLNIKNLSDVISSVKISKIYMIK